MPNYKYIEVAEPDRGLNKFLPPTDIDNRQCADCRNVWFANGVLKKRYGYGLPKDTVSSSVNTPVSQEIIHMVMFDQGINEVEPTRRLLAMTADYLLDYDETNDQWDYDASTTAVEYNTISSLNLQPVWIDLGSNTSDSLDIQIEMSGGPTTDKNYEVQVDAGDPTSPNTIQYRDQQGGGPWDVTGEALVATGVHTIVDTDMDIMFLANTGQATNDNYYLNSYYSTRPTLSGSVLTTTTRTALTDAYHGLCTLFSASGEFYNTNTLQLRIRPSTDYDGVTLYIRLFSGSDVNGYASRKYTQVSATLIGGTWNEFQLTYSNITDTDYQNASSIGFLTSAFKTGTIEFDYVKAVNTPGSGATGVDTKNGPVSSVITDGNVESVPGSRLIYTHIDSSVRYVEEDANISKILAHADAGDGGYNTTRANHIARALSAYKSRLHLIGTIEESSGVAKYRLHRQRWCDILDLDVWDTGTSGYVEISDTQGQLLRAEIINDDNYIFKTDSIVRQTHIGGEIAIFDTHTVWQDDALVVGGLLHGMRTGVMFVGHKNVYYFDGSSNPQVMGDRVFDDIYDDLNYTDGLASTAGQYHKRSHCFEIVPDNLILCTIPAASQYPDKSYVYDYKEDTWTIWDFSGGKSTNITAGISYYGMTGNNLNHATQFGNASGEFYQLDKTEKNDGNPLYPINAYWDSKAFRHPEGRNEFTKWPALLLEGKGDSVTVKYKADDGDWSPGVKVTLSGNWKRHAVDLEGLEAQTVQIRFENNEVSSTFDIRWFSLQYDDGAPT